ncbi:hypothetical protein LXL04_024001 [Taraxacum kok-saghyz]
MSRRNSLHSPPFTAETRSNREKPSKSYLKITRLEFIILLLALHHRDFINPSLCRHLADFTEFEAKVPGCTSYDLQSEVSYRLSITIEHRGNHFMKSARRLAPDTTLGKNVLIVKYQSTVDDISPSCHLHWHPLFTVYT